MLTKKKKIIVLVGMLGLLVITGVVNVVLNNRIGGNADYTGGGQQLGFFAEYRANRTTIRQQTFLELDAIIANANMSEQVRADAETTRLALVQNMEMELVLEGLIRAMGFGDVVVSSNNQNINVIVQTDEGTSNIEAFQAAQILDIIVRETDRTAQNVRIIPVEG
ncbi:MAG: SpoIIIAH-like family protein [Firmicutes bacterium]|nr:SpoIIIAH-like family protein [Bacillota bacterium]